MAVLLVTYDLKKPGQDYKDFLEKIKSYGWARLSESSYAISTSQSPQRVFDSLRPLMDANDRVYIVQLTGTAIGYGSKEVNDWLTRNGL